MKKRKKDKKARVPRFSANRPNKEGGLPKAQPFEMIIKKKAEEKKSENAKEKRNEKQKGKENEKE